MSSIRKQSIISSVIVYIGFALGFLNTYLFTREGSFTESQYGLTGAFIAIANVMYSFATLGMQSYIYKFYPYYNDNLERRKNDMITWAMLVAMVGFTLVTIGGIALKDLVIRKFGTNSAELVQYYYWIFPFGLGLTIYSVLEAYAWQLKRSVLTNYLRELQFRIFTTILIVLFLVGVIKNFDVFIKFYALTYFLIAAMLFFILWRFRELYITFNISRVTRKFFKKIVTLAAFVWSGNLIYNVANVFDTIILAAVLPNGLAFAGIFTLAQNIASLVQAPQRGIISASVAPLAQAWKDKDMDRLQRVYQRSSINMLVFSIGMFGLITLNFIDGVETFHLKATYVQALPVFLFIGLMRILDMGTGLNSQIIGTSTFWRFEFFTGIVLLAMALPLNYYLTKSLGVIGPAISNLIAFTVYNTIRCVFLYRKFKMQPFTINSLYTVLLGALAYMVCFYLFSNQQGFAWICVRSLVFVLIYATGVIGLKITPDVASVILGVKDRLIKKKS